MIHGRLVKCWVKFIWAGNMKIKLIQPAMIPRPMDTKLKTRMPHHPLVFSGYIFAQNKY